MIAYVAGPLVVDRGAVFFFSRLFDLLIALAYFVIPLTILFFLYKERIVLSFPGAAKDRRLFRHVACTVSVFVLSCGATHTMRFITLFYYNVIGSTALLGVCSCVSVYTSVLLLAKIRRLLMIITGIEIGRKGETVDLSKAFDIVVACVPDMLSVHNLKTLAFLHSNEICSSYGHAKINLVSCSLYSIVHLEDHPILGIMLQDCILNQQSAYMFRLRCADKTYTTVESIPKIGRWDNQQAVFLLTRNIQRRVDQFDKVTKFKQEQARLDANRHHAMTLAHELRTSLAIYELAMREIKLQPSVDADLVSSAENAVWFMKFVIERTVECCRVLQGEKPSPFMVHINLVEHIRAVIDMLSTYPRSVPISVCVNTDQRLQSFSCDRDWLESVLACLVCNACDNTLYGAIEVSITNDEHKVRIEVRDSGVGIQEHDVQRLFCPFLKMDNKLKPEHGLGIGLYNCSWRLRFLGGSYGYRNNVPTGSIFYFELPLSKPEIHDHPEPAAASHALSRRNLGSNSLYESLNLLVVDDAIVFRKLLIRQLERRGIVHIDEAADGVDALVMLKNKQYDMVLMDNMMPLMTGTTCIKEYKAWEAETYRFPPVPFVLLSADIIMDDNEMFSSGLIIDFLQKPVNMLRLMTILRDLVTA